jgi:formamidopyrimidine-DNA glycosylase
VPELPEVEVVRRGLAAHVLGRVIADVEVRHPRAVRRHVPGADDLVSRLRGRQVADVRRRGKYLWLDLLPGSAPLVHDSAPETSDVRGAEKGHGAGVPADEALVMHLGMSGQLLVQPASAPAETHLRVVLGFADGDPQLRFVDQRTFGGLALEPLLPVPVDPPRAVRGRRHASPGGRAVVVAGRADGSGDARRVEDDVPETVPASVAHIARDPLDPLFDLERTAARLRAKRSGIKRALLDQTLVSGIGNIYADESLWRVGLHGERPTDRLTRQQARDVLTAAGEVMRESLAQGGTSFDALYVNVNGQGGYFERHLAAYGRAGEPCDRCGTPIVRQAFMNRSSYSCPRCQPQPRARRAPG